MKKSTYYFTHDFSARTDPKIKKLLVKHGLSGYGLFWCIIEDLNQNDNTLPIDVETMSFDYRCDIPFVSSVIHDFGLFEINYLVEPPTFGSLSVARRMEKRAELSKSGKRAADERWKRNASASISDAEQQKTDASDNAKEKKGTEQKGNEMKSTSVVENGHSPTQVGIVSFLSVPTVDEISNEFRSRLTSSGIEPDQFGDIQQMSQSFFDHYESRGWMINDQRVFKWKPLINKWITVEKSGSKKTNGRAAGSGESSKFDWE